MAAECISGEQLYLEYYDKVSAYVRGKIQNHHEAEDVISSVFLKIYQKLDTFDPAKASISTWIYTVTRNTVVDYYRTHRVHASFEDYMEGALDEIPEETNTDAELLERLAEALETLKKRDRDLIILHYYKGYTLKKIAEMMQMSYINAKVVHSKALKQLGLRMRSDSSL